MGLSGVILSRKSEQKSAGKTKKSEFKLEGCTVNQMKILLMAITLWWWLLQ